MGVPWPSSSCPSCLHIRFCFPVNPVPTDFHTGTTKNNHPTTSVQQQEPAPPSSHFYLFASAGQMISTCFNPKSPLLFFYAYINTTHNGGSKNSVMVVIAADTFATNTQLCPSQPHLSRGTHLLIKTVSIVLSHMDNPTRFLQALLFFLLPPHFFQ